MLSLYKLEIFARVAQAGNMSVAAQQLFMSHASVSQHIKELEASLGVRLFERGRRGVTLTQEGEKLYEHTQAILQLVAQVESDITDVRNLAEGKLTLSGTPGVTTFFFPNWLQSFRREYSHIEVGLNTGTTREVTRWVVQQIADIGFTEGEPDENLNISAIPLAEIPQYVIVSAQHPWWHRESIKLAELNEQQLITREPSSQSRIWLERVFEQNDIRVETVAAFDAVEPIKRSVSISDHCFTVLPEYAVQSEISANQLRILPIVDVQLTRNLWLIRYGKMPLSPIAKSFLQTLTVHFPTLQDHLM